MNQKIQNLINDGLIRKQICDELKIERKQLDIIAKELNLLGKLQENAVLYTNKNLANRAIRAKNCKIQRLKEKYDFNFVHDLIVNKGYSLKEIELNSNVLYKDIRYIANLLNIRHILKTNNKKGKSRLAVKRFETSRNNILIYLNTKYKDKIKELLYSDDECTISNIQRVINDPKLRKCHINHIIKLNGLEERWKSNFTRQRYNDRIRNSKKGAEKLRGTTFIRRDVTDEMIFYYQSLKEDDSIFNGQAKTLFHKKFKTSSKYIWATLQSKYGSIKKKSNKFLSGKLNTMYGKLPGFGAGAGINGHVFIKGEKLIFRSLLELRIFLYLDYNNIIFTQSNHRIEYDNLGKAHIYHPDIVINDTIYEIKPETFQKLPINMIKFNALREYCALNYLKCEFIGYHTYDLTTINKDMILNDIIMKKIIMTDKQYNRLLKNI